MKLLRHNFTNHKYNVGPKDRRTRDGIVFDSIKEADYYSELQLRKRTGEVLFFLRQVPFHLPGGVRYVADFMVFKTDGTAEIVDVKGPIKTESYKAKKRMVEALYPVEIKEA